MSEWRVHPIHTAYRVSDDGRAESCHAPGSRGRMGVWRPLKPHPLPNGYRFYCLRRTTPEGRRKTFHVYAHRMVLEAFVGPCPDEMECRHLDGDRGNNRLSNLAWGTRRENAADTQRHGRRMAGANHHRAKLDEGQVEAILSSLEGGMLHREVAAAFGVCRTNVTQIRNGKLWRHVPRG